MGTYRIAEVAQRSGFTPAALRYYEDIGLVAPAGRSEAGYRLYDDASLDRLRFVARAKQLGCSLDEIADLATAWDGGECGPVQDQLRARVAVKIADAQDRIAELTALAADLQRAAAALRRHRPDGPCDADCGCTADPTVSSASGGLRRPIPPGGSAVLDVSDQPDVPGGSTRPDVPGRSTTGAGEAGGMGRAGGAGEMGPGGDAATAGAGEPVALIAKGDAAASGPAIACTLGTDEMAGRLEGWRALLEGVIARRPLADGVRLEFGAAADVAEIARLAAAEQGCCRFFGFAVVIDDRGTALEVHAPAHAADVVSALFGGA